MNVSPLVASLSIAGACLLILPAAGVSLRHLFTIQGGIIVFALLIFFGILLTLMQPMTRPKKKGPVHPMTKAGNLFGVVAVVFAGLSMALGAGLGLVTAAMFMLLAVGCWVFGAAFRAKV